MKPLDPDVESLLREWIEKADADLEVARQMAPEAAGNRRIREIVGFHCQQAVEKYLKALLTYYQVEFPKTHQIHRLLILVDGVNRAAAAALASARWLGPFGVEIRYPGDAVEMIPGDEVKAVEMASLAKQVAVAILGGL